MLDTWTCHVCGRTRPDSRISVFQTETLVGRFPVTQNVRYCNDNPACVEGAKDVSFIGKQSEKDKVS